MRFLKNLPFSYPWILKRLIGGGVETILDLGCGDGSLMKELARGENWQIVGIDLWPESIKRAKITGVYQKIIKANVSKLPREILLKKFDLVLGYQVLEHLDKISGKKSLARWETLTGKKIIVAVPSGFMEYQPIGKKKEEYPFQKHLSGWRIDEFKEMGYWVRGQGLGLIYGKDGLAQRFLSLAPLFSLLSYLCAPLVFFQPKIAAYLVCVKNMASSQLPE